MRTGRGCSNFVVLTNNYFKCKEIQKVLWKYPRSLHWHQIDLVITRREDLGTLLHTRSYHSADCDKDHSLVASKVRLKPRKIHHAKGHPCSTSDPVKAQSFASRRNLLRQPKT